jgi:PAS domain S-box-containing protein
MQPPDQNIIEKSTDLATLIEKKSNALYVLHVDDDPALLKISKQNLIEMGTFKMDNACSVDEAFEKLSKGKHDVVVSDFEMPRKDGLTFLKELREKNSNIPFILFTEKGREEVAIRALNLDADRYVNKNGPAEVVYRELADAIKKTFERKKSRELLQASELKYRELANSLPNIVFESDINGKVEFVNDKGLDIAGISREEFEKGVNIMQFIIPEDRQKAAENMQRLLSSENYVPDEYVFLRKDGSTFPTLTTITLRKSKDKVTGLRGLVVDISERKKAEEALKQTEENHKTLLNSANVLIQSVNAECRYVYVNDEWKKTLGYTDKDLEVITMMNVIRKDQITHCMNIFKSVVSGNPVYDVETVFVAKDGKEIVVHGNACPIFKEGKFASTDAFFLDITERKKNEEKLKENSRRIALMNEKLSVVGSLTRHDVRNKLSAVTGYAYLLKKKHGDQVDIVDGLSKMEQAVKESVRIFEFAKMYEQLGLEELTFIDVEDKVKEAIALFSGSHPNIINECNGLTVLADSFLRQLFFNLIDNTIKYGKKALNINIHYEKTEHGDLELLYEDDGIGIPFENKPRLFEEGFSTGGSTGFGLFLTKKMMDIYGWKIEENGEPGMGAKFILTIPKINQNGKENFKIAGEVANEAMLSYPPEIYCKAN